MLHFLALTVIMMNCVNAFAAVQGSSIPTAEWDLRANDGEYSSSAYVNGYRLYTNYYFLAYNNGCHFYGTSYNATGNYYLGIINYDTGYTYLISRSSGTTTFNETVSRADSLTKPIGSKYYCGFNMTQTGAEASIAFGVGTF